MTDYTELIRSLRNCSNNRCTPCDCGWFDKYQVDESCKEIIMWKATAAIEALQAEVKRLKEANDELREAQTYIDHYGDRWMTSAKDVPTAAYEHGYADGLDEAMAKMEVQDGANR